MADWYGQSRSNYFRVKDPKKFKSLCARWGIEAITKEVNGETLHGFLEGNDNNGALPNYRARGSVDLDFDDFCKELSKMLVDNEVAVMMECGAEKLRYLTGCAIAINNKNKSVGVHLEDIYEKAKILGLNITQCEY